MTTTSDELRHARNMMLHASEALTALLERPHGEPPDAQTKAVAADAAIRLCNGDRDRARTLWKQIQSHLGYVPHAAAVALIWAAKTENLVPDVEAPAPE